MGSILVMGDDFEMVVGGGGEGGLIPLYRLCIGVDVSKRFCLEILWHVKLRIFIVIIFQRRNFYVDKKRFSNTIVIANERLARDLCKMNNRIWWKKNLNLV